jgi:hypothetical protein
MIFFAWVSGVIFLHMFFLEDIEENHGFFGVMYPILRRLYRGLAHHFASPQCQSRDAPMFHGNAGPASYFWCPGNLDGSRFKNENQDSSQKKVEI